MKIINDVATNLAASYIEREDTIRALFLGLISGEHVMLVGPPGTAKSSMCRSVASAITGMKYCERLLAPTTPPEEIFGPVSMKALKEDRYEHVIDGSVADAHLVFLDEFFRCNDAILDTLLHLLGPERQALIGNKQVQVPLMTAVAASNSWPDSQHQQAIFDRWLIRVTVKQLSPSGINKLLFGSCPKEDVTCSIDDVKVAQKTAQDATFSSSAKDAMTEIINELIQNGIRPSDRRFRKSLTVAKSSAVLDGRTVVEPHDLECLSTVLWDAPQQADKAHEIVTKIANPGSSVINSCLAELAEIVEQASTGDTATKIVSVKKIDEIEERLKPLTNNTKAQKAIEYARECKITLHASMLGISMDAAKSILGGK